MRLLAIGAGGALGSIVRYLLDAWVQRACASPFPFGTLAVNVLGCFALALCLPLLEARGWLDGTLRLALTAGLLGGFTTYSAFNERALELLRARDWVSAITYLAATLILCLAAGIAGHGAGRWLVGSG
jgi:CrcB protein